MTTIGAYAFITPDWAERDYPLDLWLMHHIPLFDQVSLVKYPMPNEDFELPAKSDKLIEIRMDQGPRDFHNANIDWCCRPKYAAMQSLTTEWKFLLEVDEFIRDRPSIDPAASAYHCNIRNLFGNVNTQVVNAGSGGARFCEGNLQWKKLHRGNQSIYGDGCAEQGPAQGIIDVFHTTILRRPHNLGYQIDYSNWQSLWESAYLVHVTDEELPSVFVNHKDRFNFGNPK